jgi:hypothetical protein
MKGTAQVVELISDEEAAQLWRTVDEHAQVDGRCPICLTARRCWPRAGAIGGLMLADRWTTAPAEG